MNTAFAKVFAILRRIACFACVAFVLTSTGCRNNEAPVAASNVASSKPRTSRAAKSADSHAVEAWAKAFTRWAQGSASSPNALPQKSTPQKRVVFVDVMALARRHPAWRMAEAIEAGKPVDTDFPPLVLASAPLPSITARATREDDHAPFRFLAGSSSLGSGRVTAHAMPLLQASAEELQRSALDAFLRAAQLRQSAEREARAQSLQTALDDDIAAARHADLSDINPDLPSDAAQLEMTNLRLQLAIARLAPAENEAARQRLQSLERQWQEMLRAQENERAAQLTRLREDLPRRLRAEGQTRLAAQIEAQSAQDAIDLQAVRTAWSERIAADFSLQDANLNITLSGDKLPGDALTIQPNLPAPSARRLPVSYNTTDLNPTFARIATSNVNIPPLKNGHATQTAGLRQVALNDANRWLQLMARRNNWKLESRDKTHNDATAVALRMLHWH